MSNKSIILSKHSIILSKHSIWVIKPYLRLPLKVYLGRSSGEYTWIYNLSSLVLNKINKNIEYDVCLNNAAHLKKIIEDYK